MQISLVTSTFARSSFRWVFGLTLALLAGNVSVGQEFNLEGYLRKKDTNRNGRVEPEELSNSARGILKKMGFDDSKSNSISKIVAKANKAKKALVEKSKPSNNRTRKTQGFGVEKTESEGVSRFGATAAGTTGSTVRGKSEQFSKSVVERVESTLKKYDSNKDGSLDRKEISRARWGSPAPEQNDTNRDGRLSKQELSVRYASREQMYSRSKTGSTRIASTSRSSKEGDDRARRAKERESYRSSGGSTSSTRRSSYRPSTTSSPSRTASSTSRTAATSNASAQAKYERYATSLVASYDTDKDGKLNKEETKKMRRPPAGADANKDGFITKDELIASLNGTNKKSAADKTESKVAVKETKSKTSRDRGSISKKTSRGSSTSRASSSFDKLDTNTDKQIQMHEFAEKWNEDLVKQFYEKDKNRDGVITLQEWSGK